LIAYVMAAAVCDDRLPSIDKLDQSNWPVWKLQIQTYLEARDLWRLWGSTACWSSRWKWWCHGYCYKLLSLSGYSGGSPPPFRPSNPALCGSCPL